jgi:N-acetylmuramoyl-L-alanine amidase
MDARDRADALDRELRPECVADVPLQIKEDLAEGHFEPDRPPGERGPVGADVAAAAARILVDFDASPHGGHWRPLPDSGREPAIAMQTVIHHSIVGSAEGAFQYFAGSTAIESHFIVKKSGYFWQCMSLGEQADANFRANAFAGSIETEDNGDPDRDPWTPAQIDTLVWLSLEMRRLRPLIARRKCRTWDDPGIGYHTLFPRQWTNVPGKLLALDTPVPTPGGLLPLRDIRIGDTVFDEHGRPCRVTATYDDIPRRAYRMTFNDGTEVLAGAEHQWLTLTSGQIIGYFRRDRPRDRHRGPKPTAFPHDWARWGAVRTTDELSKTLRNRRGGSVHNIPLAASLNIPPRELPVDPYLLGAWLGDGGSRDAIMWAGERDAGYFINRFLADGYRVGACGRRGGVVHWRPLGLEHDLRILGVLGDKHVPVDSLYGSESQRLALLQGLMDTDGYAGPGNAVEFCSTREQLANAVVWLAASLGQRPRLAKGVARLDGVDHGPKYRVTWRATRQVFALPRKAGKLTDTWTREAGSRILVGCDPVPVMPMRCLTVDSPNSMYLITDRCLPTHNTCPGAVRKRQWADRVLPRYLTGAIEEDDMTPEQARQLRAVYNALIVPGTTSPEQTVNILFERVRAIEEAMTVPGTTTAEEAFNLLFARVRRIENLVEQLAASAAAAEGAAEAGVDYERLADKVAERLAGKLAE